MLYLNEMLTTPSHRWPHECDAAQGIIPQKREAMARKSVQLIAGELMTVEEVFAKLDAEDFILEAEPSLWRVTSRITSLVLGRLIGTTARDALPAAARREIVEVVMEQSKAMAVDVLTQMKACIADVFDLEAMVVRVMVRDPRLLVDVFQKCGEQEFLFLERSGAYFGFVFGLIQMLVWLFYRQWWILPVFGLLLGWATNEIAIKLIFRPVNPLETMCGWKQCCCIPVSRCCCGKPIQGLFLQRQEAVSEEFASMTADTVMSAEHIVEDLKLGDGGKVLLELVARAVERQHRETLTGMLGATATLALGEASIDAAKMIITEQVFHALPQVMLDNADYMKQAFDIEPVLAARMKALSSAKFEGVLHPVFEEDEWKLIAAGAVLGAIVGFAQAGLSELAEAVAAGRI